MSDMAFWCETGPNGLNLSLASFRLELTISSFLMGILSLLNYCTSRVYLYTMFSYCFSKHLSISSKNPNWDVDIEDRGWYLLIDNVMTIWCRHKWFWEFSYMHDFISQSSQSFSWCLCKQPVYPDLIHLSYLRIVCWL